jgi:hypothetical protein
MPRWRPSDHEEKSDDLSCNKATTTEARHVVKVDVRFDHRADNMVIKPPGADAHNCVRAENPNAK